MKANLISLILLLSVVLVCVFQVHAIDWAWPKIVGITLITFALPLFVLARLQLGSAFSLGAEAHLLVTTGLYAKFRNPIYLFGGLTLAGFSLFRSIWGPVVIAAVFIPLQMYRVRSEEKVLMEAFGEKYEQYKRQTWF